MKKRNDVIDVLKGIGICLIVLGHTNFFGSKFLYLFHVAIFIISSGYFFNNKNVENYKALINVFIKKVKSLYLPYVIANVIGVLLNNVLIKINVYSLNTHVFYKFGDMIREMGKVLCFRGVTDIFGPTWFLHLLFIIIVLYHVIQFFYKRVLSKYIKNEFVFQLLVSIVFLLGGWLSTKYNYPGFINIYIISLNCYWLYFFGHFIKQFEIVFNKINIKISFLIVIISSAFLLLLNKIGSIEVSKNIYTNPLFFVLCSILGWFLIYYFSSIIKKTFFKKLFTYVGKNSLYILLFHFIGFKICIILLNLYYKRSLFGADSFFRSFGKYSFIYFFIIGIVVPLIFSNIYFFIKKKWRTKV